MITETCQASKVREIPDQIETLQKGQELLRQRINTLQERLSPALRLAPPDAEGKHPKVCRQTEVGKRLNDANEGLQGSIETIDSILDRLEI